MLIGTFYLIDFFKIAFSNKSLWVVVITMISFAFVFTFYLLRDRAPSDAINITTSASERQN